MLTRISYLLGTTTRWYRITYCYNNSGDVDVFECSTPELRDEIVAYIIRCGDRIVSVEVF
jgi:hypothetical protein